MTSIQPSPTTLAGIAERAGVSTMTVSRALRLPEVVAPETRSRILAIAKRLHFVPNEMARALARKRTGACGLVLPECTDPAHAFFCAGVEKTLRDHGIQLFLCNSHGDAATFASVVKGLHSRRVDGLIAVGCAGAGPILRRWLKWGSPLVLVDRPLKGFERHFDAVNYREAARLGAAHLAARGRRNILLVNRLGEDYANAEREAGWRHALREAGGRQSGPPLRVKCDGDLALKLKARWKERPGMDGVLCCDDRTALAARRVLGELGLHAPRDYALAGMGDIQAMALDTLGLTSVSLRWGLLGQRAVARLLLELGTPIRIQAPTQEQSQPAVRIRESCGAPLPEPGKDHA